VAEPRSRYSLVSIVLHWSIAVLIVWNILLGWNMGDLPPEQRFGAYQTHKSIGLTVLTLSLLRLGWRLANPAPPLPSHMKGWERLFARGTHVLFYVLMIGVPLGGWALVSSSPLNLPTSFWGLFDWPHLPLPKSKALSDQIESAHGLGAWIIVITLGLHVAGALKHQFLDRDTVLWRMLPIFPKPKERA
jgi:cytochrome b561